MVVGLAAAVALLLGIVAVLNAGDDESARVSSSPEDLARLVLGPATDAAQLPPMAATDLPLTEDDVSDPVSVDVTLYGDPGAGDPFAPGDLAVFVVHDGSLGLFGDPTTVRGSEGAAGGPGAPEGYPSTVAGMLVPGTDLSWVTWYEDEMTTEITLVSRTLGTDALAGIAEQAEVDGSTVRLGSLPAGTGTAVVGRLDGLWLADGLAYAPTSAVGHVVAYGSLEGPTVVLGTFFGDPSQLAVARWMADARDEVEVRGHRGWSRRVEDTLGNAEIVLWEEDRNVVGVAQGTALDGDLVPILDDLVAATDEQWESLPGSIAESGFLDDGG